jgi:ArsR family transcriptional regulator, arsenate/arsenite/antimonite-responsive transcriptional repressor
MKNTSATIRPLSTTDEQIVKVMKALGNPVRFQIMQILVEKQTCITGEIVEFTSLAQSTVSQHLKVLREASLISGEVEGPATCYCINADRILWLKQQVNDWIPTCCQPDQQV